MLVMVRFAAMLLAFGIAAAMPAQADTLNAACVSVVENETEDFVCQVRTSAGKKLNSVTAETSGGRGLTADVETYQWTKNRSAWIYLVQKSGVSSTEYSKMVEFLGRAAFIVGRQAVGVGTYTDRMSERATLGSFRTQLDRVYRDLRNASPESGTPSVLQAARDAIDEIKDYEADRKSIVLLVNDTAPSGGPSIQDIIDLAREHSIVLFPVLFSDKAVSPLGDIERLADETGGVVTNFANMSTSDIQNEASGFSEKLENGSIATIPAAGISDGTELVFTAEVEGGQTLTSNAVRVDRKTDDAWHVGLAGLLEDNLITILAIAGLGLGAGLVFTSLRRSKTAAPAYPTGAYSGGYDDRQAGYNDYDDYEATDETVILAPGGSGQALGWLELLDQDIPPVPINGRRVRIGRHTDNDLRLTNGSVHRQHAVIDIGPNGTVVIRDLDTRNGVIVNGTRYAERELANGDVIELGEVRLRFRPAA